MVLEHTVYILFCWHNYHCIEPNTNLKIKVLKPLIYYVDNSWSFSWTVIFCIYSFCLPFTNPWTVEFAALVECEALFCTKCRSDSSCVAIRILLPCVTSLHDVISRQIHEEETKNPLKRRNEVSLPSLHTNKNHGRPINWTECFRLNFAFLRSTRQIFQGSTPLHRLPTGHVS